jgi:hypothetical protein
MNIEKFDDKNKVSIWVSDNKINLAINGKLAIKGKEDFVMVTSIEELLTFIKRQINE